MEPKSIRKCAECHTKTVEKHGAHAVETEKQVNRETERPVDSYNQERPVETERWVDDHDNDGQDDDHNNAHNTERQRDGKTERQRGRESERQRERKRERERER